MSPAETNPSPADTIPEYLVASRRAIDEHGAEAFESLLFLDPAAQTRRFEVFASTLGLAGRRIADIGCGRGDLLAWMRQKDIAYADYIGCDAMPEFIAFCKQRAIQEPHTAGRFFVTDFVADAEVFQRLVDEENIDILLFSGSLNTLEQETAKAVLERAWQAISRRRGGALAFNFLSQIESQPPNPIPTELNRFGAESMVRWALEHTPLVLFCQYYLGGHDATIVMIAGQASA